MRMSGFSKVEMSALPPGGRDRGDGDVDHGGTGALRGAEASRRAAADATAGGRAARAEPATGRATHPAVCRARRRGPTGDGGLGTAKISTIERDGDHLGKSELIRR